MQYTFFSNLVILLIVNLLIKPIAIFGIDAEVQNRVGSEEYGFYFALLNFTCIFNIILDFGITNFNTKYVAQYPHLVKNYLGKIIPLRFFLFLAYTIITLSIGFILGYNSKQFSFLSILIVNQFLISVIQYFRSYFAGLHLFKFDIFLSVLDKLILILIVGYILYGNQMIDFEMIWFVYAQTLSYALACLIAFFVLVKKIGIPVLKWSKSFNRSVLFKSFPYALLILLMMLYNRLDAVMLERLNPMGNGAEQAGIYAQSYRILDALVMFGMLFSSLLYPILSRLLKQKMDLKPLLDSVSRLLFSFSIIVSVLCFSFSEEILGLIYSNKISESILTFKWLMSSLVPIYSILIFGTLLTANGNLKTLNILSFVGLIANLILNFILIPNYGAFGATMSTIATQSFVAVVQLIFAWRYFNFKFNRYVFFNYLGFLLWISVSFYVLQFYTKELKVFIYYIIASGLAVLIFNMLQWKSIIKLVSKSNH
jgi:O-antigen/teichoic acid export membrane protein